MIMRMVKAAIVGEVVRRVLTAKSRRKAKAAKATRSRRTRRAARARA